MPLNSRKPPRGTDRPERAAAGYSRPARGNGSARSRGTGSARGSGRGRTAAPRGRAGRWSRYSPLLWGGALIAGLILLGYWSQRPGEGDAPQAPASDTRSAAPVSSAGAATAAPAVTPAAPVATPVVPGPAPGASSRQAAADAPVSPGAAIPASPSAASGGPAPAAFTVPADQMAARQRLDRSEGREAMPVTVYFVDGYSGDTALQPVTLQVPHSQAVLRAAVNQLLQPPEYLKLSSGIPAGTRVYDVSLQGGVATVNLSEQLYTRSGSTWANTVTYCLVYTLTEFDQVERVQLLVAGKPAVLEGREWSRPIGRADLKNRGDFTVLPVLRPQS